MANSIQNLIDAIKKKERQAERMLFDLFYGTVYQIAYSLTKEEGTSEDIVQETFIKVFSNLNKLENPEKIESWVKTIARRTAYDRLRKQKKWNETEWQDVYGDETSEIETTYEEKEIWEIITKVMGELEPMQREILRLKLVEEYSDEEIARELSIKIGTVKSRIHRAKGKVRERLMKGGGDDETFE